MGIAVMCLGSLVVARSTLAVTTERSSIARVGRSAALRRAFLEASSIY